jgi:3-phenylpropionate/cinnamic acid dioxygenase small subunit
MAGHEFSVAQGRYVFDMASGSAVSITNLLYRYAELMDAGDLESAAALFTHARIKADAEGTAVLDSAELLALWRGLVKIHPDGTPRTKHVVTNPILDIDEEAGTATCRSYYTVLQQSDAVPLQVVAAGRYHDEFERVDGVWRFSFRDYSMLDLKGDLRDHLGVFGGEAG